MKKLYTLIVASAVSLTVCAQRNYEMGNPNDPNYDYLKDYAPLKDYIDYSQYPNFKLGIGTTASEYTKTSSTTYHLTNDNFTETVAGNAMKMASCVSSSGSMNFNTVKNYVNTATNAGLNVYGHTLAWHAQQPVGWLNSLLKDKPAQPIEGADIPIYVDLAAKDFRVQQNIGWHADFTQYGFSVSYNSTDGLIVHCTKKCSQNYEVQYIAMDGIPAEKGKKYKMIMTIKGSTSGSLTAKLGDWSSGPTSTVRFTDQWQDVEVEYNNTVANPFLLLQHGLFVGDVYIKSIKFQETVMGKNVDEERRCLVIATAPGESSSDTQLNLKVGSFEKGATYKFSALVRADKRATVATQIANGPENPIGNVTFTQDWRTVTAEGTLNGAGQQISFNLADLEEDNRFCFDNISLIINNEERIANGDFEGDDVSSFTVRVNKSRPKAPEISTSLSYMLIPTPMPLTPEEKRDTLVWAMDKWIKGMMEACNGKVKAWDVVNEAISGDGNDGGFYTLQHDNGDASNFFWQDHMGDLEYVRNAIRLARKYGPSDIKLFINDYNLESDWDDNKKLKSLINWIKRWEADGETYVDGIGSQMHISCYMKESTQTKKKNAIKKSFELMAATGKLVRISELDMGMVDANGNDVHTANMTEEMHHRMADLYEWIFKTYLEVVPPAQQWGICCWCPTDSPTNSGWRADTPVGIWTLNTFYRKHVYAGIVRGLGGQVYSDVKKIELAETASTAVYNLNGVRQNVEAVRNADGTVSVDLSSLPSGIYVVGGKKVMK